MQEALGNAMIDPKTYFIKDPKTSNWVSLEEASEKGFINLRKKVIFCQISKRKDQFIIKYNDQQICDKKPNSVSVAIKEKYLNILSGRFTDSSTKQIFNLKQAVDLGFIDSGSAIVKDTKENHFHPLDRAFDNHTLDPEKGIVINTLTNQVLTLKGAIDSGLLRTAPCSFSLIEAIEYGMYDPQTHLIQNPFNDTNDTLEGCIASGLVDPTLTLVKDRGSGNFFSVSDAIQKGILCPKTGRLKSDSTSLGEAHRQGLLVPSEKRVRIYCSGAHKKCLACLCYMPGACIVACIDVNINMVKIIIQIVFPMNTFYSFFKEFYYMFLYLLFHSLYVVFACCFS